MRGTPLALPLFDALANASTLAIVHLSRFTRDARFQVYNVIPPVISSSLAVQYIRFMESPMIDTDMSHTSARAVMGDNLFYKIALLLGSN